MSTQAHWTLVMGGTLDPRLVVLWSRPCPILVQAGVMEKITRTTTDVEIETETTAVDAATPALGPGPTPRPPCPIIPNGRRCSGKTKWSC